MRIERPDLSKISGGEDKPQLIDLKTLATISSQVDTLQVAKSAAQMAQSSKLGSSAPNPGSGLGSSAPPTDPVINSYEQYIQDLIDFLIKEEGVPASALQFIKDALSNIDPNQVDAGTKLMQILHQLFAIGMQVDPNFLSKVTNSNTAAGADAEKAKQEANNQTTAIQNEIAALIKSMGPSGKIFQDMIEIQAFLAAYPGNMSAGFAFKAFGDAIIDLTSHTNDAPPWGNAVLSVFSALSAIHNGVSLSDLIGTLYFLEMYSNCSQNNTFSQAIQKLAGPLQNAIKALEGANSPFCEEIVNKLLWWQNPNNLTLGNLQPFIEMKVYGNNQLGGFLRANWATILENECTFPQSAVSSALQEINQMISTVELAQYPELALLLANASQAERSFDALFDGNWQAAFPEGSGVQGPLAPDADSQALQTLLQALVKVMLEHSSDPQVQTLLAMLFQVASGPPYPQTIVSSINEVAESYCALYPLSSQDKALLQKAFGQIDNLIQNMQNQENAAQSSENAIQDLLKSLQGFPNCSDANYEKAAADLWNLLQAYENAPSGPLKDQITRIFDQFANAPGNMGALFGSYLNAALLAQGKSSAAISAMMTAFMHSHPDLARSSFLSSFLTAGGAPNPLAQEKQDMINLLQGHNDIVVSLLDELQKAGTSIQGQIDSWQQLIGQQQTLENDLKNGILPGMNRR